MTATLSIREKQKLIARLDAYCREVMDTVKDPNISPLLTSLKCLFNGIVTRSATLIDDTANALDVDLPDGNPHYSLGAIAATAKAQGLTATANIERHAALLVKLEAASKAAPASSRGFLQQAALIKKLAL